MPSAHHDKHSGAGGQQSSNPGQPRLRTLVTLPALTVPGVPGRDLGATGRRWMRSGECRERWSCLRGGGGVLQTEEQHDQHIEQQQG